MKKATNIPSLLLSEKQTEQLHLHEQPYIILIPRSILDKNGITNDEIIFELNFLDGKILLSQK